MMKKGDMKCALHQSGGLLFLFLLMFGFSACCSRVRFEAQNVPEAVAGEAYYTELHVFLKGVLLSENDVDYQFSLIGGRVPPGLAFDDFPFDYVVLEGTPTEPGVYDFTLRVRSFALASAEAEAFDSDELIDGFGVCIDPDDTRSYRLVVHPEGTNIEMLDR